MKQGQEHFCRYLTEHHEKTGGYRAGTNVGFPSPHLAYVISGSCRVEYNHGKTLHLQPGDVWYIPKGLPYTSHWVTENVVTFDKLEFEADGFSLSYRTMQAFRLPELKADFAVLCGQPDRAQSYGGLAAFYRILSILVPLLKQEENRTLHRVLPALRYLQQQDFASVRVEELAAMCYMSTSRFYEVFREAVGESPINYKNKIRLSHAKTLIQEGKKLDEVCELLHFSSPSFLRRMMKKYLGITPKAAKQHESI